MDLQIRGSHELERIAKQLKDAGEGELRKELLRSIRENVKPTITKVKANARTKLPKSGGLAAQVAKSRIGVRTRTSGDRSSVRIEAKNKANVKAMDGGRLRHPVYGNREVWATQSVDPGWFSEPIEASLPQMRAGLLNAMEDIARKAGS